MVYVLTHGSFQIVDTPHKGETLGQKFDLSDELAKSAILSGACLLPEDKFTAIGFTADELAKYSNAVRQASAPASFHEKHAAALAEAIAHRQSLAAEEVKS
jgi:hypothetical protein